LFEGMTPRSCSVPQGIWGLGSRHRARPELRATTAVPTVWRKMSARRRVAWCRRRARTCPSCTEHKYRAGPSNLAAGWCLSTSKKLSDQPLHGFVRGVSHRGPGASLFEGTWPPGPTPCRGAFGAWGSRHRARSELRAAHRGSNCLAKNERPPPGARLNRRRAHTGPRITNTLMASRPIVAGIHV
jgi:hypothetical protein